MEKKKVKKISKEELAEDWYFVCKDGGDVRICDHKQCRKSYHPGCLEKDIFFLHSESHFDCHKSNSIYLLSFGISKSIRLHDFPRHTCSYCGNCAILHCYTCTYSTCQRGDCIPTAAEFLRVKGENGFCHICLKLVLLVEEGRDIDSDGERVDLTDLNSVGLFVDYYLFVKKVNGIESTDILAAQDNLKCRKDIQSGYSSGEYSESAEDQVSDCDYSEYSKKRRKTQNVEISKRRSTEWTHFKSSKLEFIGWGSKPLIDFLSSIGRSTAEKISLKSVASVVNEYIKENKLFDPHKRKLVNSLITIAFNHIRA